MNSSMHIYVIKYSIYQVFRLACLVGFISLTLNLNGQVQAQTLTQKNGATQSDKNINYSQPSPEVKLLNKTPKKIGLSLGWAYTYLDQLPNGKSRNQGLSTFSPYLWQIGGLHTGWSSWIGLLTGVDFFPDSLKDKHTLTLKYGVLIKHEVFPSFKISPFLSYGLGAMQVWVNQVRGRGISHYTRLSLGVDLAIDKSKDLSLEVVWSQQDIPYLQTDSSRDPTHLGFQSINMLLGIMFNVPATYANDVQQ
jgi:hypothetical protein